MANNFYRRNAWWLSTGILLMAASSFGQTYFIALFAGGIREDFGLSNGEWGGLYTIATLGSAALLAQAGKLADTMPLARLAALIGAAYALSAVLMATAPHVAVLALGIFGLRFCGQGMMTHISMTAMARWFAANRGKAMAIAFLGFPLGEALFPLIAVEVLETVGWRGAWLIVAGLIAVGVVPAAVLLLRRSRIPTGEGAGESAVGMEGRHWTRQEVLRHWAIYAVLPGLLATPFIGTCVFFHQVHIAELRGFDLQTMALAFPMYAAIAVSTSLLAGPIVDRVGATRLLPFAVLPMGVAILVLAIPGGVWVWFVVLAFTGMSQGVTVTLIGALWPTLYGTRWIGSIRAIVTAMMVLATALGPGITGLVIDLGVPFPSQAPALALVCLLVSAGFAILSPKLTRSVPRRYQPA